MTAKNEGGKTRESDDDATCSRGVLPCIHREPGASESAGQEKNAELEWAKRHIPEEPDEVLRIEELLLISPAEKARRRYRCRKLQELRSGRLP